MQGRTIEDMRILIEFADKLDQEKYHSIIQKYWDEIEHPEYPAGVQKYADVLYWCAHKLPLVKELGLHQTTNKRILVLGTGAGHFILNKGPRSDGSFNFDGRVLDWFEAHGATTVRDRGIVDMTLTKRQKFKA